MTALLRRHRIRRRPNWAALPDGSPPPYGPTAAFLRAAYTDLGLATIVNRYSRLLDHDAILTEGHNVNVGQVLSHYANQLGGVHYDPSSGSPPRLLLLAVKYEEPLVREAVLAVARVVVRGLQPLVDALARQPLFVEPAEIPEHIRNLDNGTGPIPGDSAAAVTTSTHRASRPRPPEGRSAMTDQILIAKVQQALNAAAEQIHVNTPVDVPAPAASGRRNTTGRPPTAQRWLLPAAAAAAVVILLATGVFLWHQNQTVATATQVSISGDVADVGGVRFPVPPGWDVAVTKSDAKAVHVCVAVNPAADCDGVQFDIAVPGWFGNTELLSSGTLPMFDQCPAGITTGHIIMTDDHNPIDVAGRPGIHFWGYCGNSSTTSHLWQLNDLSLQIYSPPGRYVTQISAIVAGLDLTQWAHHQGPQAAFITSGSTAPPTS